MQTLITSSTGMCAMGHSSSTLALSAVEKSPLRWKLVLYFDGVWQSMSLGKKMWTLHRCMCDGERLMGWAKHYGLGSRRSVIKLDLLSFRILTQVEVMASRLCSISIKSFDFILCSILASTSITGSSRTRPEPPWTFSSSTTSESCHDLPSVWIWIQQSTCKTNPKKTQWSVTKTANCSRSECSLSQEMGRDSNGLYQLPYSPHVQEMRVWSMLMGDINWCLQCYMYFWILWGNILEALVNINFFRWFHSCIHAFEK